MHPNRIPLTIAAAGVAASFAMAPSASAELIYGLTTQNSITVFDSAAPGASLDGGFITGLAVNENILALDYRAGTNQIYLLGSGDNVCTMNPTTFAATFVGSFAPPSLRGIGFAFAFNPAFNNNVAGDEGRFSRIISDTDNNRVIDGLSRFPSQPASRSSASPASVCFAAAAKAKITSASTQADPRTPFVGRLNCLHTLTFAHAASAP